MPGIVIGSPLSFVGEAWIGATDATTPGGTLSPPSVTSTNTFPTQSVVFVVKPTAFGPSSSVVAPAARRTTRPEAWSNTPVIQTPRATFLVKSASFPNGQSFYAAKFKQTLQASSFANSSAFQGPHLTLRISAAAYTNTGQIYTASISQGASVKLAPHCASSATLFTPAIFLPATTSVTVTLSLPGSIPRAPKPPQRRSTATWPNLPKVAAPPWRLTVVTPDVARERARQRQASVKRTERLRRKHKAEERSRAITEALIDDAIAHTIVRVIAGGA